MLNYKWTFYAFLLLDLLQKKIKIKHASPPQQRLSAYPQCLSASSQTLPSTAVPILDAMSLRKGLSQSRETLQVRESTQTVHRTQHVYSVFAFSLPIKRRAALQRMAHSLCQRKYSWFLPSQSQGENLSHRSHRSRLNPRRGSAGAGQPRARSCCRQIRPRTLRVGRQRAEL